eukprot:4832949-Amphidinium_carterae.1
MQPLLKEVADATAISRCTGPLTCVAQQNKEAFTRSLRAVEQNKNAPQGIVHRGLLPKTENPNDQKNLKSQ